MGQSALPGNKNPDVVLITAKENMSADLLNELIGLHEKIVLQSGSELSENKNLTAHPDRHQGHGLHQPAQQLRHVGHRQSPSARSCTRRRSSSTRAACVEHQEFRLAQICALHIIVNPDELEDSS